MACFFYIVLTPISTTSGLLSTGNTRKYHQIDVFIYQCEPRDGSQIIMNRANTIYLGIISFDSSMYMYDPHDMIVSNLMKSSIDLK